MNYQPASAEDLTEIEQQSRDWARATRSQYEGFIESGFTDQQALLLTRTWMQAYIARGGE